MSLRASFAAATALSGLLLCASPVLAWTTAPAPLNSDGTPKYVDPEQQYQSEFSQSDQTAAPDKAGSFHFSATSQQGFGTPQGFFGSSQGYGSPQGYSTSNAPGSEFYNLGAPYQSHPSNW
jgi:hypothetical protein